MWMIPRTYSFKPTTSDWKWLKYKFMEYWKGCIEVTLNTDSQKQYKETSKKLSKKRYISKRKLSKQYLNKKRK